MIRKDAKPARPFFRPGLVHRGLIHPGLVRPGWFVGVRVVGGADPLCHAERMLFFSSFHGKRKNTKKHGQQMQCLTMPFLIRKDAKPARPFFRLGLICRGLVHRSLIRPELVHRGLVRPGWFVGRSIGNRVSEQSDFSAVIPRAGKRSSRGGRRRRGILPRGCRRGGWVPWRRRAP